MIDDLDGCGDLRGDNPDALSGVHGAVTDSREDRDVDGVPAGVVVAQLAEGDGVFLVAHGAIPSAPV